MAHRYQALAGLAVAVGAVMAIIAGLGCAGQNADQELSVKLPAAASEWREGDIIFRRGTGPEAAAIRAMDESGFTHVGLLAGKYPDWDVVHVEPEQKGRGGKVEVISLKEFASRDHAYAYAVFRVEMIGNETAARTVGYARRHIGIAFDGDYRYFDDGALYCTELVGKAYQAVKVGMVDWTSAIKPPLMVEPILTPAALLRSGVLRQIG